MRLEALFQPRSIAVVGASEKPTIGRRLIASLDRIGFAGRIFPINPNYPACSASPAIRASPNCRKRPIWRCSASATGWSRCVDRGGRARHRRPPSSMTAGLPSAARRAARLQAHIAGICRDAGIALCGPNCMGVLSPHRAQHDLSAGIARPGRPRRQCRHRLAERRVLRQPA